MDYRIVAIVGVILILAIAAVVYGMQHSEKAGIEPKSSEEVTTEPETELVKEVKVEFLKEGKTVASAEITDNHQRLCRIDVEPVEADTIRITPVNTHGAEKVVLYEARVYS